MDKAKAFFVSLGTITIFLGIFLLANSQSAIMGATIGAREIAYLASIKWGVFFLSSGSLLLILEAFNKNQKT